MAVAHDPRIAPGRSGGDPQVEDVLGEIAAAVTYLETLRERLHVGALPGECDAAAIPPSTLIAVRRSCQRIARHSGRALAAMSPRRAAQVGAVAAQVREVELLRAQRRSR
jgi:hypothetical protein